MTERERYIGPRVDDDELEAERSTLEASQLKALRETGVLVTPNQIVGYRLFLARRLRGLTQDEAAARLEPYLGKRWSKASFSAAERSFEGGKVRHFSADEIAAFARAFDLPISWFYIPPSHGREGGKRHYWVDVGGITAAAMVDVIFGRNDDAESHVAFALNDLFEVWEHQVYAGLGTGRQRELAEWGSVVAQSIIAGTLGDLARWQETLRELAETLETAERVAPDRIIETFNTMIDAPESVEWVFRALAEPAEEEPEKVVNEPVTIVYEDNSAVRMYPDGTTVFIDEDGNETVKKRPTTGRKGEGRS